MNRPRILPLPRAESGRAESRTLCETFQVNLEHGLHARPCALLVKTLRPFRARVQVEANGHLADGHSIIGLMTLGAGNKTSITFTITGEDAALAMRAVSQVFATQFQDAYLSRSISVAH